MAKKLSYEEIINFIEGENGNGCKLISEEYKGNRYDLEIQCKCGENFETTIAHFKRENKRQCNKCGNKLTKESLSYSYEYIKKYIEDNSYCKLLIMKNEYINTSITELKLKCKCGNTFQTLWGNFTRGKQQCNNCGTRKSHEQFCNEIDIIHNGEYEVLSNYITNKEDIIIKHKICGHVYPTTPDNILQGRRCPKCFKKERKSLIKFIEELNNKFNNEYTVLQDTYINNKTSLLIQHNLCKYSWDTIPCNILKADHIVCPKCNNHILNRDHDYFKQEVWDLVKDEYEIYSEYNGYDETILFKHHICNHIYPTTPHNFLSNRRCPICNESKGELKIRAWLENNNMLFGREYDEFEDLLSDKGNPLRFDFIIFNNNNELFYLIEYDGKQHYEWQIGWQTKINFETLQYHDKLKNAYCLKNNIPLLRIPYWEFDNIEEILNRYFKIVN